MEAVTFAIKHKTQLEGGFWCLELCLYIKRELVSATSQSVTWSACDLCLCGAVKCLLSPVLSELLASVCGVRALVVVAGEQ